MREWAGFGRSNPGISISKDTKQSLHLLADPPTPPVCEEHGLDLVEIENADLPRAFDVELRENASLYACPKCFPSKDDEIDVTEVASEIASEWMHYRDKFVQSSRPDMDTGPTFRFI